MQPATFAPTGSRPSPTHRLDHEADVLVRHTAALGIVLGAASLVRGAGNTIAGKPLALTGRYTAMPAIRSVEVGEWLRAVLTPGGMRRVPETTTVTSSPHSPTTTWSPNSQI